MQNRPPAIDTLLRQVPELPRPVALAEARALVQSVRAGAPAPEDWAAALRARVAEVRRPSLRRVINATGVVLHTNLGRAPMSPAVAARLSELSSGYCNLEFDLETGERGERLAGIKGLIADLCGAEAAVAVNNNAAAVLLMLTALAQGKEVIVSRGELVEIGGSFRVPDVITAGGARLREVGTTNRTRLDDYARAITPETGAILLVHPSNFRVIGFTERPERAALAALAQRAGVPLLEDLGSGAMVPGLGEPEVSEVIAAGVDVACFSGDKLLGGPQAGIAAGRATYIQKLRKHALYRALRLDRLVLSALEVTLSLYRDGEVPPAVAMLKAEPPALKARAEAWARALRDRGLAAAATVERDVSFAGGGSRPEDGLPTYVLALRIPHLDRALTQLRHHDPPLVARIADGALRLDPRTVLPGEDRLLIDALASVLSLR